MKAAKTLAILEEEEEKMLSEERKYEKTTE